MADDSVLQFECEILFKELMATNGKPGGGRRGAIKDRTQVYNPQNDRWTKRGPDGKFMDQKADDQPFKGVTKEK